MKNFVRSTELHDTDHLKADASDEMGRMDKMGGMPVLAIHIHPIMALKARLPKLRAAKLGSIKGLASRVPKL